MNVSCLKVKEVSIRPRRGLTESGPGKMSNGGQYHEQGTEVGISHRIHICLVPRIIEIVVIVVKPIRRNIHSVAIIPIRDSIP